LKDSGKLDRGDMFDFAVNLSSAHSFMRSQSKLSAGQASDPSMKAA
jgi:hypothetical protein